jgi:ATP-dependent exoDNAse (exonuclease V) beta subunit
MRNREQSDKQDIHIVKASAGSGKTFRLTGDYLRLLFSTTNAYKHILAVTFTNKATDEMKSRIIKELYNLSAGEESGHLAKLIEEFHLSETQVRQKSSHILKAILHDYSAFAISTIDKFFQQTMRAFTREIGLSGGYKVELDDTAFLPEVIDIMLSELANKENKELANWLLAFMQDKIKNDKSWSIKDDVLKLATEIFNENYKSLSQNEKELIHDKEHLTEYKKTLTQLVRHFENELKTIGEKGANLIHRFGLHYSDFKGGKNSAFSHFAKWANGDIKEPTATFVKLADNVDNWTTKTTPSGKIVAIESVFSELNEQVKLAVAHFENSQEYFSARNVLNYFYTLGILNDVQRRLQQLQQDEDILFLSDTTELLSKIIDDALSPFIYEKIGTRFNSYMMDEFQDTSAMQWDNFRPLIKESADNSHFNLIVGDVKQSIYRWRNSDWRLLEEKIPKDKELAHNVKSESLDTNWRSDANVVHFNNALFETAPHVLQNAFNDAMESIADENFKKYASNKINEVYAQASQLVPEKNANSQGKIDITFLRNEKDDDWEAEAMERLPKQIEQLQDDGFQLKEIAILVRGNKDAIRIAETLLQYKEEHPGSKYRYDIISNEALIIGNAQSVKAIIALLRWFNNRNDKTKKMLAVYEFYRFHRKISPDEALQSFLGKSEIDFPDDIGAQLNSISYLPFYEMIEAFFALSKDVLSEKENAYVQAFLDIALKFSTGTSSDIDSFLKWWSEKGYKKALFSPDNQDAIRIVTIHKSKGLEFGVVLMPLVNWEIDHKTNFDTILWCRPDREPFNALSIVPLRYGEVLGKTIFWKDYLKEKMFTYIDNLNLLYVAFTRAKHRIVAFAPQPKSKPNTKAADIKVDKIKNVADLLWKSFAKQEKPLGSSDSPFVEFSNCIHYSDTETHFSFGSAESIVQDVSTFIEKEPLVAQNQLRTVQWQSIPFDNRLQLRFNSIGYFSNDGSRDYGTLMHDIISRVETTGDIPQAVERKILSGELSSGEKKNVVHELTQLLSIHEVSDWYSGAYTVLNEMQMLHPRFGFSRPDRVMLNGKKAVVVDYKFGETENKKYNRQVQRYVERIKEMGYVDVEGFVFYVKMGKVLVV